MSLKQFSGGFEALMERVKEIEAMPPQSRHCEHHGDFESKAHGCNPRGEPSWSGCPTCAAQRREAEEAESREQATRVRKASLEQAFRRSGIPERFLGKSFGGYLADTAAKARALKAAQRYAESEERGLSMILCGKPGTGKTHLACSIASAKIAARSTAQFMTAVAAVRYVRSTYRKDSPISETEAIDNLCSPDLLILDEVGVQHGTEHEKMILFDVINDRYANCRGTVLLSNLSADDLREYLGDRIMDRFREGGFVLNFDWESHRGKRDAA